MVWQDKAARLNDADNAYKFTSVLLEALRLMVEGHNKNMQTLLQSQPLSTSPLDLVLEAVELLSVLQDHVPTALASNDDEVANLMVLVCGFLQEMVQGPCLSNQQALSGTDFLASCNRIFGCIEYGDKREPSVDDRHMNANKCAIKDSLLRLLMSLLEASPNSLIPDRCYEILDFGSIDRQISRLCRVLGMMGEDGPAPLYDEEEEEALKKDKDDLTIVHQLRNELLSLCAFMLKLNAVTPSRPPPLPYLVALYNKSDVERLEDLTPDQRLYAADLQAFLTERLGYVEINWAGHIEPCFFPLTKECSNVVTSAVWCEVTLDRLHNTVSPDSRAFPTVKAAELVDVLEAVVDDIELEAKLTRTRWLKAVSVMAQYRMVLLEATFYLAVATLIFQALADARWGPHTAWEERGYSWKTIVLSVAVMTQSACTVLLYLSFVYTDLSKFMSHEVSVTAEWLSMAGATVVRVLTFWRGKDAAGKDGGGKDAGHSDGVMAARKLGLSQPPTDERRSWLDWVRGSAAAVLTVMRCSKFWYFNMLVTASFAGFFVSPFFLVFHFTIYFLDFDSGKQLVLAIERSGINILNTFVLAVLAIYVFAVVTFLVFTDPTEADKGDGPPCGTFYQCMGAHMLTGIMGDISSLFNSDLWDTVPEKVNEDGLQQARTIVVLVFFMLWNFVLSNIFVGLIASAFEAIRDDQNTITSDRLSKCLVCSLDMYTFNEMIQGGFEEHIDKQHNALMYVFFLHHLRSTEPEDYAGAESVVARVLATAKTSTDKGTWLPVSKSLAVMHANAANGKGSGAGGGGAGGVHGE